MGLQCYVQTSCKRPSYEERGQGGGGGEEGGAELFTTITINVIFCYEQPSTKAEREVGEAEREVGEAK